MLDVLKIVQEALDESLYQEKGIKSFHLRKVETSGDSTDTYIVYSLVSAVPRLYGDGKKIMNRYRIDINLYYDPRKMDIQGVSKLMDYVKEKMELRGFALAYSGSKVYDSLAEVRGVNMEFSYLEVEA